MHLYDHQNFCVNNQFCILHTQFLQISTPLHVNDSLFAESQHDNCSNSASSWDISRDAFHIDHTIHVQYNSDKYTLLLARKAANLALDDICP